MPVINRKTSEKTEFGPRRAYDGAWVLEMLRAYGCTKAEVEATIFVLEGLIEHDVKIDKDLPNLLRMFSELRRRAQTLAVPHNRRVT